MVKIVSGAAGAEGLGNIPIDEEFGRLERMSDHGCSDTNGWFTWGISSERGLGILLAEDATY
jgi:hypothetical protein